MNNRDIKDILSDYRNAINMLVQLVEIQGLPFSNTQVIEQQRMIGQCETEIIKQVHIAKGEING